MFLLSFHYFSLHFRKILSDYFRNDKASFGKFRTIKRAGWDAHTRSIILEERCRDHDELIGNPRWCTSKARFPRNEVNFYRETQILPLSEQDQAARSNASSFFTEDEKKKEKKKRIGFPADGIRKNRILEFLNACPIHKIFIDRTAIVKRKKEINPRALREIFEYTVISDKASFSTSGTEKGKQKNYCPWRCR